MPFSNKHKEFFEIKEFDIKKIRKKAKDNSFIALDIKASTGKTDVVGAKLLKIFSHLKKQMALFGFTVFDSDWKWDKKKKCEMYFMVKEKKLSKTFVRQGPPINEKQDCIAFKIKNKDVFEKNKRLYANVLRKYKTPKSFINHLIKENYIKSKAEKIRLI